MRLEIAIDTTITLFCCILFTVHTKSIAKFVMYIHKEPAASQVHSHMLSNKAIDRIEN